MTPRFGGELLLQIRALLDLVPEPGNHVNVSLADGTGRIVHETEDEYRLELTRYQSLPMASPITYEVTTDGYGQTRKLFLYKDGQRFEPDSLLLVELLKNKMIQPLYQWLKNR
jgi:hypothetical protein